MGSKSKTQVAALPEVSSDAGPSKATHTPTTSTSEKKKRPQKRTRSKKRTSTHDQDSDDSDDDADDSIVEKSGADGSKEIKPKKNDTKSNKEALADSDSDSDSDDDTAKGKGTEEGGKRKRKRKRGSKKDKDGSSNKDAAASSGTAKSTDATSATSIDLGPDPSPDQRLSDVAKQAIQYAQQYSRDKTSWKFNKAKQNWLLRNVLAVQPADYDPALARAPKKLDKEGAEDAENGDADEEEEGESFIPDDMVSVVAAYLKSVMGGAKQRLIDALREAVNAPEVPEAPSTVDETPVPAETTAANGANGAKSVSFGTFAMEAEKKEEEGKIANEASGPDSRTVELRRKRARFVLAQMGESQ